MKIIEAIVNHEGINTNRIVTYITNTHVVNGIAYYANNSISQEDEHNAACSIPALNPSYYEIIFPYDTIVTNKFRITTFANYRFPLKTIVQGTKNTRDYYNLTTTGPFCSTSYGDCGKIESIDVDIDFNSYKGFKIILDGKDSGKTTQMCIGQFEIFGYIKNISPQKQIITLYYRIFQCLLFIFITFK